MPADDQSPAERLAAQFYAWERRGRGWAVWPYPVDIEPPFRPFLMHALPRAPREDDGRVPTFGSRVVDLLRSKAHPSMPVEPDPSYEEEPEVEPSDDGEPLVPLGIVLPIDAKITRDATEQLLSNLLHAEYPIGFEVIGDAKAIRIQVVCREADYRHVSSVLRNHFPEAVLSGDADALVSAFSATGTPAPSIVVDFGLSEECMLPLRRAKAFDPDPLIAVVAAMEDLREGELGAFQVLFRHARHSWAESILRAVADDDGRAFFGDAPEMVGLAREKAGSPLFAVTLRAAAASPVPDRVMEIARRIAAVTGYAKEPLSNEIIPLSNDEYPGEDHWADLIARTGRRAGMLLNLDELLTFAHLPSASVRSPKLLRVVKKTHAAPAIALQPGIVIGENVHAGEVKRVSIPAEERVRHTYLIGASGTGKSTLMLRMIQQDIEAGRGVAVLDPHGDLVDQVASLVPEVRIPDTVLFDPSDEGRPVAWNILQAHTALEKTLLSSDLVATFRRLSTSWGDQMNSVLSNAVLAFLESTQGGSIADLRRFLVDTEWRKAFLTTVTDPEIVFYWQREFPLLANRSPQAPILTRLDTFLRPKIVRAMVTAERDRLDFREIMDNGRIFLAKLSQGAIGEENAWLLGSLLVSKFQQVALSRQNVDAPSRRAFFLYLDEFHHFITPSLASILSGARKYGLGLILAHQDLRQLASRDADVAAAVVANPSTRICFRVGETDAKRLEESFTHFTAKDLQNLGVGEAVVRIERSDWDFTVKTAPLPAFDAARARARREAIVAHSRERYGRDPHAAAAAVGSTGAAGTPELAARDAGPAVPVRAAGRPRHSAPPAPASADQMLPQETLGGRGGPQHKYIQDLVRRWALDRGYRVEIEKTVLDGLGTVDVVLEKAGRPAIACEISVTTSAEHEIENAEKCLAAGFDDVFLVAPDRDALARVRERASKTLQPRVMKKLRFVLPEQVFAAISVLESKSAPEPTAPVEGGDEVLTAGEVERLLKIDVKTIYRYAQKGMIPYVRVQSNLRFIKSEVLAWFREHGSDREPKKKR